MIYSWRISAKGKKDSERTGRLEELERVLEILALPGVRPPKWIIAQALANEIDGRPEYIFNEGGKNEWRLSWVKVHNHGSYGAHNSK